MKTHRMLEETVTLYNYIGEVNDEATYEKTILKHCYCVLNEGASVNGIGHKPNNSAKLYIFDEKTLAVSENGTLKTFLPYEQWKYTENKSSFWTLSDCGKDYFQKTGSSTRLRISSYSRKAVGRKIMWHFEVNGV